DPLAGFRELLLHHTILLEGCHHRYGPQSAESRFLVLVFPEEPPTTLIPVGENQPLFVLIVLNADGADRVPHPLPGCEGSTPEGVRPEPPRRVNRRASAGTLWHLRDV